MKVEVISKRKGQNYQFRVGDILIDRSGPYGNPYLIGRDGNRLEVIQKFRNYVTTDAYNLVEDLYNMNPKRLVCW